MTIAPFPPKTIHDLSHDLSMTFPMTIAPFPSKAIHGSVQTSPLLIPAKTLYSHFAPDRILQDPAQLAAMVNNRIAALQSKARTRAYYRVQATREMFAGKRMGVNNIPALQIADMKGE